MTKTNFRICIVNIKNIDLALGVRRFMAHLFSQDSVGERVRRHDCDLGFGAYREHFSKILLLEWADVTVVTWGSVLYSVFFLVVYHMYIYIYMHGHVYIYMYIFILWADPQTATAQCSSSCLYFRFHGRPNDMVVCVRILPYERGFQCRLPNE